MTSRRKLKAAKTVGESYSDTSWSASLRTNLPSASRSGWSRWPAPLEGQRRFHPLEERRRLRGGPCAGPGTRVPGVGTMLLFDTSVLVDLERELGEGRVGPGLRLPRPPRGRGPLRAAPSPSAEMATGRARWLPGLPREVEEDTGVGGHCLPRRRAGPGSAFKGPAPRGERHLDCGDRHCNIQRRWSTRTDSDFDRVSSLKRVRPVSMTFNEP